MSYIHFRKRNSLINEQKYTYWPLGGGTAPVEAGPEAAALACFGGAGVEAAAAGAEGMAAGTTAFVQSEPLSIVKAISCPTSTWDPSGT